MNREMLKKFSALVDGRIAKIKSSEDTKSAARESLKGLSIADSSKKLKEILEYEKLFELLDGGSVESIESVAAYLRSEYGTLLESMARTRNVKPEQLDKFKKTIVNAVIRRLIDARGEIPTMSLTMLIITKGGQAVSRLTPRKAPKAPRRSEVKDT